MKAVVKELKAEYKRLVRSLSTVVSMLEKADDNGHVTSIRVGRPGAKARKGAKGGKKKGAGAKKATRSALLRKLGVGKAKGGKRKTGAKKTGARKTATAARLQDEKAQDALSRAPKGAKLSDAAKRRGKTASQIIKKAREQQPQLNAGGMGPTADATREEKRARAASLRGKIIE